MFDILWNTNLDKAYKCTKDSRLYYPVFTNLILFNLQIGVLFFVRFLHKLKIRRLFVLDVMYICEKITTFTTK